MIAILPVIFLLGGRESIASGRFVEIGRTGKVRSNEE
jgi:hypothetical protein